MDKGGFAYETWWTAPRIYGAAGTCKRKTERTQTGIHKRSTRVYLAGGIQIFSPAAVYLRDCMGNPAVDSVFYGLYGCFQRDYACCGGLYQQGAAEQSGICLCGGGKRDAK